MGEGNCDEDSGEDNEYEKVTEFESVSDSEYHFRKAAIFPQVSRLQLPRLAMQYSLGSNQLTSIPLLLTRGPR